MSPTPAPTGTDQPAQRARDSSSATSAQFLYYTLALISIIASVCLISLCYRSSYFSAFFKCNKARERTVEVIIETDAAFQPEPNYVDADSCTPSDGDVFYSAMTNSQKMVSGHTPYAPDTESGCANTQQTPIAVAATGRECSAGNVLARMIGVMDNVPAVPSTTNRTNLGTITTIPAIEGLRERNDTIPDNSPYPYLNIERNRVGASLSAHQNNHYDYDYLIQTQRNMDELNDTITRITAANESREEQGQGQGQDIEMSNIDSRDIVPLFRNNDSLQVAQAVNDDSIIIQNSRRGESIFYSDHSVNRRTSPIRNNDPCSQQ